MVQTTSRAVQSPTSALELPEPTYSWRTVLLQPSTSPSWRYQLSSRFPVPWWRSWLLIPPITLLVRALDSLSLPPRHPFRNPSRLTYSRASFPSLPNLSTTYIIPGPAFFSLHSRALKTNGSSPPTCCVVRDDFNFLRRPGGSVRSQGRLTPCSFIFLADLHTFPQTAAILEATASFDLLLGSSGSGIGPSWLLSQLRSLPRISCPSHLHPLLKKWRNTMTTPSATMIPTQQSNPPTRTIPRRPSPRLPRAPPSPPDRTPPGPPGSLVRSSHPSPNLLVKMTRRRDRRRTRSRTTTGRWRRRFGTMRRLWGRRRSRSLGRRSGSCVL